MHACLTFADTSLFTHCLSLFFFCYCTTQFPLKVVVYRLSFFQASLHVITAVDSPCVLFMLSDKQRRLKTKTKTKQASQRSLIKRQCDEHVVLRSSMLLARQKRRKYNQYEIRKKVEKNKATNAKNNTGNDFSLSLSRSSAAKPLYAYRHKECCSQ